MGSENDFTVTVFAPVIFFGTLIAVLLSKREVGSERWPQKCAKWILIACAALLLLATAGVVFGPLGVIGLVFFILFIGAVISYGLTSRRMIAAYVISTIGSSIRQNLPLPMALEAAAERVDKRARILRKIQNWLVQGYPLSEAIKRGYPRCPAYAVAMIAAAERINQLPFAIKSIEADMLARTDESRRLQPMHPVYPVILLILAFSTVLGLMTYVVPLLAQTIMEISEGRAMLPAATRLLIGLTRLVYGRNGQMVLMMLVVTVLAALAFWLRARFRPRRPQQPYLLSRIGDFIRWHLPVLHWFARNYSMVQVVELLRLSLNAGCTVNDAIAGTLALDVNNCFRKRLQQWLIKVQRGENVAAAARESKLGSTIGWAFDDKVNQGNTLAILEMLESFYRSNYSYRANLARFIMWPCVTITMGIMVGFIVYSIFGALITIVNETANLVYP
jgi:type II secretory pathway component PulF